MGPGYFKGSQSLISQAEMAKISRSYISRQDRALLCYCCFLLGFSRAVNSGYPLHFFFPCTPSCLPSPLSAPHFLLEISVTLIHSLPLVNKEILCQLSPTTSCWESGGESNGPESLSHQRGAVGLIKWPLCPAGCWWPGDR